MSDHSPSTDSTKNLFVGRSVNNVYQYVWGGVVSDRMMTVPNHQVALDNGFTPGQQVREYDYFYNCYGIGEGQPYVVDFNGDGTIDDNDKRIFSGDPKWTGSLVSNLNYRLPKNYGSIDFGFTLYAKYGYFVDSSLPWR